MVMMHIEMKRKDGMGSLARNAIGLCALVLVVTAFCTPGVLAQGYANDKTVGVEEKLGEVIPLDLAFKDEAGNPVTLGEFITKPTVLTLVYFRCPSICSPLMHEVAATVDKLDQVPGIDFNLLTVSFDDREGPDLARIAKANLLDEMEKKIDPGSWRFLTGDAENIAPLTDSVGFRFKRDKEDYLHPATVIFLSPEGKIVRYLGGLKLLPADMKMAIIDAAEGTPRSIMQKIQRLCFSFDPEGRTYVLQVNRIVLFATLFLLGVFLVFLLVKGRVKTKAERAE
jgi:protein SCO1/2